MATLVAVGWELAKCGLKLCNPTGAFHIVVMLIWL